MLEEIKSQVDSLGRAWDEFQKTNDARLKEVEKKGSADALLDGKLDKINTFLDETKSRLDLVETAVKRTGVPAAESGNPSEQSKAFNAFIRKGDGNLTEMEKKALSVGSDPDGGYLVTPQMSNNIIKIVFETSPMRALASVETISSDSLDIPEDRDEISASWVGETGTRSETDTPTVGKKNIPAHELYAEPRATQKILDDAAIDIEQWLSGKIAEYFARTENTAFVSGNGVSKPRGILSYSAGSTWGTIEQVASGTSASFDADDLISLFYTLKSDYAANASWLVNRAIEATLRKLKDGTGQYLWQPGLQAGQPNLLLGKPVYQASDMPVAASDSLSIAVGDFRRAYQIVDRKGITTLRDPFTAKPYIKFYTTKRVGGDVVNFEALKLLKLGA